MTDAQIAADDLISELKTKTGIDYTTGRDEIARVIDEDIWSGNWDTTTDFEDDLPNIRIIEENEYDQSMDDDERPDWDDILFQSGVGYVLFAN